MAARKKNRKSKVAKPTAKKVRKARSATPPPAPEPVVVESGVNVTEAENQLISRYPHVVSGTLLMAGDPNGFPTKRSVQIKCRICGSEDRRVATSDLFQSFTCGGKDCKKAAREEVAKS